MSANTQAVPSIHKSAQSKSESHFRTGKSITVPYFNRKNGGERNTNLDASFKPRSTFSRANGPRVAHLDMQSNPVKPHFEAVSM